MFSFNFLPTISCTITIMVIVHFEKVYPTMDSISGQLELRIDNFSKFVNAPTRTVLWSPMKMIRGLNLQLKAVIQEQNDSKFLLCSIGVISSDLSWTCAMQATMDIIVGENKVGTKHFQGFMNAILIRSWNFEEDINKLLDSCRTSQTDVVIVTANVKPDPPAGRSFPNNDVLIVKNNKSDNGLPLKVNKKLLALHSPFFNDLFFPNHGGASSSSTIPVVQLDSPTVIYPPIVQLDHPLENFKNMILVLHFGESILKDANVEEVLRLAKQFKLDDVQGRCVKFILSPNCKLSKLKRFHIAFTNSLQNTKKILLNLLTRDDFSEGKNFMKLHKEMEKFSMEAKDEVDQRYYQLFPEALKDDENNKRQKTAAGESSGDPIIDQ